MGERFQQEVAATLLEAMRRGEPESFRQVYEGYQDDVLAVAAAVLGRAAGADAWDVLHDVFIGLARNATTLRPGTSLRAYLVRAAVNRARDRLRRRETSRECSDVAAAGASALDRLELDEAVQALWQVLPTLPAEQRTVVALRIWGEQNFREIAEAEGISENTAQSRWRYAIEKLRRHLEGVER